MVAITHLPFLLGFRGMAEKTTTSQKIKPAASRSFLPGRTDVLGSHPKG
jgi:hypothetical protein